jgi:hypothetical protein
MEIEVALDEALRLRPDQHLVRTRELLEPRCDVRRIAHQRHVRARVPAAELACDDEPGVNPDADRTRGIALSQRGVGDRQNDRETGANRPAAVVLVRLRIAEVHEQPIAEGLCDVPAELGDRLAADLLIRAHHLTHLFRIDPCRELGRTDQVAKQYGHLAALTGGRLVGSTGRRGTARRHCRGRRQT